MISVRRAEIKDIPMIMQFLDEHWLKGYALAHNRELFEWQFVKNGKVNIAIAVDEENEKMYGMEGAIAYSGDEAPHISSCLWICEKTNNPTLSLEITEAAYKMMNASGSYGLGLLKDAIRVHKLLKHDIMYMDHYYRLRQKDKYVIAKIEEPIIPPITDYGWYLEEIDSLEEIKEVISTNTLNQHVPRKDCEYISWRYLEHPVFKYYVWKICNPKKEAKSIIVTREENYNGSKSCKIVDFYGDDKDFIFASYALDSLMSERDYEYIDIYSVGFPKEIYDSAGFVECSENSRNIIPNHFQPYSCENSRIALVDIHYDRLRMFRGDSDQDKPRLTIQWRKNDD